MSTTEGQGWWFYSRFKVGGRRGRGEESFGDDTIVFYEASREQVTFFFMLITKAKS